MKKKSILWVVLIVVIILAVIVAVLGKNYYDSRYVGKDYYAIVPQGYDVTPVAIYDMSGKEQVGVGVEYELTAYNDQGESKTVSFTAWEEGEIPQPGTYLYISASKQIVLKWNVTDESNVPDKALESINKN